MVEGSLMNKNLKQYGIPIAIGVAAFILLAFLLSFFTIFRGASFASSGSIATMDSTVGYRSSYGYDQAMGDFAPQVEEREIAKTASLQSKVDRGDFDQKNTQTHSIIQSQSGFILNENVRETRGAKRGDYSIKIPRDNYQSTIDQLKQLGEIQAFTENAIDVTARMVNNDLELELEKERLIRLNSLYTSRASLEDKLRLEQAIFDQERKIKYLEDALKNLDQRVVYSTISFSLHEEESALADLRFVGFGDLIKTFVQSLKSLLYFLFAILPWAVVIGLIWWLVHWIRHR